MLSSQGAHLVGEVLQRRHLLFAKFIHFADYTWNHYAHYNLCLWTRKVAREVFAQKINMFILLQLTRSQRKEDFGELNMKWMKCDEMGEAVIVE